MTPNTNKYKVTKKLMNPIVPTPPEPEHVIEEARQNTEGWISYFKGLSTRIRVISPSDKEFDLKKWEEYAKILTRTYRDFDHIRLVGWPTKEDTVFLVGIDSSLEKGVATFLINNAFLFCRRDLAFGLDYFEEEDFDIDDIERTYSLESYPKDALKWDFIKEKIKGELLRIESSVPKIEQ